MAAARPYVTVYSVKGEKVGQAPLPKVFTVPIRPDIVSFVHDQLRKNRRQAYAVYDRAGEQTSAVSWGTGRAVARIPRVSGGGTQRSGQGAFGNMCRGGRMYAPTKTWRRWHRKVNVNQRRYALVSALAASAVPALVMARGHKVDQISEIPLVVEDSLQEVKTTKKAVEALKALKAFEDVERSKETRSVRAGRGKSRNRRHVTRKGPLVIFAQNNGVVEAFRNLPGVDLLHVERLNLLRVAPGGHLGRFLVFTQSAFAKLEQLYGTGVIGSSSKSKFVLPRPLLSNADLTRIINSDEVQSKLYKKKKGTPRVPVKHNPLTNFRAMVKLNPYALTERRSAIRAQLKNALKKAQKVQEKRQ